MTGRDITLTEEQGDALFAAVVDACKRAPEGSPERATLDTLRRELRTASVVRFLAD